MSIAALGGRGPMLGRAITGGPAQMAVGDTGQLPTMNAPAGQMPNPQAAPMAQPPMGGPPPPQMPPAMPPSPQLPPQALGQALSPGMAPPRPMMGNPMMMGRPQVRNSMGMMPRNGLFGLS